MSRVPGSANEFLDLLKARHLTILEHRKDKNPGVWKDVPNRAGNTRFVEPELVEGTLCRIIIPTVYRDDYITALKAFSQTRQLEPVIRMFERAQAFTASMDYSNYDVAKASFMAANAFLDPREGKLIFTEKRLKPVRAALGTSSTG